MYIVQKNMNENNILGLSSFDAASVAGSFVSKKLSVAGAFSYCTISMRDSDTMQLFFFVCLSQLLGNGNSMHCIYVKT